MCEGKNELNEKEIKQIEYEQICEDWRHRDSMLWQSLAVAITLTGVVFVAAFGKDIEKPWLFRVVLFLFASVLNFVLLLKIAKDHYYQLGSSDLLNKLESDKLKNDSQINPDQCQNLFRIWEPSKSYFEQLRNTCKIPWPCLYEWLSERSAFKWFFRIQLLLIIISFLSLCVSLYLFVGCELTKTAISKATLMSFPLAGNLSERTRRIADKQQ